MSEAMVMDGFGEFEGLLRDVLRERVEVAAPGGIKQRLLARLAQEEAAKKSVLVRPFAFAERVQTPRSAASTWLAVGAHAVVLLLAVALAAEREVMHPPVIRDVAVLELAKPPRVVPRMDAAGGGGGQHDVTPVSQGHLPKFVKVQILPPMAPPTIAPKLAVEPGVVVQTDLKMADNAMPNIGSPASSLKGFSMGTGNGSGMGNGNGAGIGPGSGGNVGEGVMHPGGGVMPPSMLSQVDAEYSEEARKAKFSGNVEVYVVVDEQGNPTHVRVVRGVGMGLDEKAVEAVRQWKFKPGMQHGKPVKVDVYVDVMFHIY
jgi:periplasmic protein TonB